MAFPCDGQNHYKAVESESNLITFQSQIENHFSKKLSKIDGLGGTKNKTDNVITFEDGTTINISLKNKKSVKTGSFDYVNTSNLDWKNCGFSKTFECYNSSKNTKQIKNYDLLRKTISDELSNMSSEMLTELFKRSVLNPYKKLNLSIIDEKTNSIFCSVIPKSFIFVENGGKLILRKKEGIKMSYSVDGIDDNGKIYDFGLRIRVHLNNGKSKWLGLATGSSMLVFKFQQDKVYSLI